MPSALVWILLVASTGHPLSRVGYPTQADCLRAGIALNQYGKYRTPTLCISERVVNPYGSDTMSVSATADTTQRAQGNYQYEQRHLQALITAGTSH